MSDAEEYRQTLEAAARGAWPTAVARLDRETSYGLFYITTIFLPYDEGYEVLTGRHTARFPTLEDIPRLVAMVEQCAANLRENGHIPCAYDDVVARGLLELFGEA